MALIAAVPLELPVDGRQSETALAVARGTARLLHAYGRCVVGEFRCRRGAAPIWWHSIRAAKS